MSKYLVAYFEGCEQYFFCEAEDAEHAKDQCRDAYPEAELLWVGLVVEVL